MLSKGARKYCLLLLILSFLFVSMVSAATISGTIYDYNLVKVEGAVLSINTSPNQVLVSESGKYSIELESGKYLVQVSKLERAGLTAVDEAIFDVRSEGIYTHDFILFEEIDEIELPNLNNDEKKVGTTIFRPILIIVFILIVVILTYVASKAQKEDELNPPSEVDEILRELGFYIKKHKRVSQKELRLQFHYSESAVSMAITQLESEGYVKKIKRGRSNIIVWIPKKSRKENNKNETQK